MGAPDVCWLRYEPAGGPTEKGARDLFASLASPGSGRPAVAAAVDEIRRAVSGVFGVQPVARDAAGQAGLVVGDFSDLRSSGIEVEPPVAAACAEEGYLIRRQRASGRDQLLLAAPGDRGLLYAAHRLGAMLQTGRLPAHGDLVDRPKVSLRMIDHWDNVDGVIERGYAGRSFFFRDGTVLQDLDRARAWARLLGSLGINAVAVNNVNVPRAAMRLMTDHLERVAGLADVFRAHGVRLWLSVSFGAPVALGGLGGADPLDGAVRRWWSDRVRAIYDAIPDFGGFLVKADSEGQPGPHTYGRTHAEGANMLAEALERHGGQVLWRCFVYNHRQDWRDRSTDRARAAYDHFMPLDGDFAPNVLLQIKNGPVDFQVAEPVSPLLAGLRKTRMALELQVTQEYTGQQRHLCCLLGHWRDVLSFDTHAGPGGASRDLAQRLCAEGRHAVVGVSNTGDDPTWTGHPLAQANLYGFGRLAWNPEAAAGPILDEWAHRTFGPDPEVRQTVVRMLDESSGIYESYTAPLGVGWMVNPGTHDGPSPDGYEYSRWGTYHFADHRGVGVDRTAATGTGYTAQYPRPVAEVYESLVACPERQLLFFHHVPYTHRLRSGKTLIQHIYDSHFEGVEGVRRLRDLWASLEGRVEPGTWAKVRERLEDQSARAREWRDVINTYFHRRTGVADAGGRVIY